MLCRVTQGKGTKLVFFTKVIVGQKDVWSYRYASWRKILKKS